MPDISFIRRNRVFLVFAGLLVACSVLVILQFQANKRKHVELREAFILLESKGYRPEAQRLYQRLLGQLEDLSDRALLDDFERTLTLVNPSEPEPDNLIWRYHWTVSNEMEKRSHAALQRALKMANED